MFNADNICDVYDDPRADHFLANTSFSNESRSAEREIIESEIFIQQSGNKLCRVTLSDISASGFRMTSKRNLDPLQPIFIRLPGIKSLSATIRWEGFKDYGCQFAQALSPTLFNLLVAKLKSLDTAS